MTGAGPRSILIVEELAHLPHGHFPVRCAQLATAYVELGYRVDVLTSEGWSRDGEHPSRVFGVRSYRPLARWLHRGVAGWRGHLGAVRHVLLTFLVAIEGRAAARRMAPEPDAVIVLGFDTDPALLAIFAGRRRWLVNQFRDGDMTGLKGHTGPLVARLSRRAEARRRGRGGCVRLAVASEERRDGWHTRVPHLDPVVVPVAGVRELAPAPDARSRLDLPIDRKLALFFGASVGKQRDVVLDAFATLDDWTLVVAGSVAVGIDVGARSGPPPVCRTGIVDDAVRDLLFAAADLVVLSFVPAYRNNSGTLMDAISAGVPVVCSDDATVAEIVTRFGLGACFANGDAQSLAKAVRTTPATVAPTDLAAARQELSNRAVARRQLLVMGIVTPRPRD